MEPSENSHHHYVSGFHSIDIGDTFKDENYKVLHKLGHGGCATVWLARDVKEGSSVALKVMSSYGSQACTGLQILQDLATMPCSGHVGQDYVSSLLDHFWDEGPNWRQLCLVMEAIGPSIALLREESVFLSIRQARTLGL